jgi:hypothetical protein
MIIVKVTFAQSSPVYARVQFGSGDAIGGGGGGGGSVAWVDITGKPATFAPSTHTHTIANVTGLQTALDGKAASSHSHIIGDVTGLQTALDGKQAAGSYAAASHTHIIGDVTGLQTALNAKAALSHTHSIAEVTGLQTELDGKQAAGSYAAASHSHIIGDVTGLQTALDGKAATSHTHVIGDVTDLQSTLDGKAPAALTANRQTASYTLVLSDATKLVEMNVASANNLTVPPNSSVAFATGTQILIAQYGAGQTTVVAGSGVTVRSSGGKLKLSGQYSGGTLLKIATNEWYLFGDIAS